MTCGSLIPDCYRPPGGVLFPYAHIVSDIPPLHVRYLYQLPTIAKFKSDLDFLGQRYHPLQLSELERVVWLHDKNGSARNFVLSFDDGMRETYDVIAPILREKGIPAIFFLNSATIDNKRLMWRHKVGLLIARSRQEPARIPPQLSVGSGESVSARLEALPFVEESKLDDIASFFEFDFNEYLRNTQPYLTTEQIVDLARQGFEFGAHSASHPCFNEIPVEEQKEQISTSVQFIRSLSLPCRYFAFPFHDNGVPASVFKYMTELDIALSFGTSEARVDSVEFSVQRFALDAGNTEWSVPDLLKQLSAKSVARRMSRTEVIWRN
jgi:peptidoglycan/xylan/chitin deacetylase (PgdA/CDA1 family)